MRLDLKLAALAVFTCLAFATRADATPPDGAWVEASGVYPPYARETYIFAEVTGGGTTTLSINVNCGAPAPCALSTTSVMEVAPNVFVAGPFSAPAPKRYFMFLHDASCHVYGSTAYVGVWTDTGGAPFIAQCFVPRRLSIPPPHGVGPRPIGPPNLPPIRIPPYVQRPAAVGPGPFPGPTPPH